MSSQRSAEDQVVMTRDGYEKLKSELSYLRSDGRTDIAAKLEEARAFGDLSENAEYRAAKEEQEKLEGRILWLEFQLSKTKIVDVADLDTSHINLGNTVSLLDLDTNTSFTYTLVGTEEADPKTNRISAASPVGKAIHGKVIGEEIAVRVPNGIRHFKITDIQIS